MTQPNVPPPSDGSPEQSAASGGPNIFNRADPTTPADEASGPAATATEVIRSAPLPRLGWLRFGVGFLLFGFLWIAGLMVVNVVILPARLKEVGIEEPALVLAGFNAAGAITALIANLVWGNFSDATRSRFGRRAPWILIGAILAGAFLWATSLVTEAWSLTLIYVLFQAALNAALAPAVAVMSDRVPQKELGTVSAFYGMGITVGIQAGIIIGSQLIANTAIGFLIGGGMVAVSAIFALIIWPKDPSTKDLPAPTRGFASVLANMRPPGKAPDFWWMFTARFAILVGYAMVNGFLLYILQDYVGLPEDQVPATLATGATITLVVSIIGGAVGGPLADLIKRLRLVVILSTLMFASGVVLLWVFPSVTGYFLWAGIAGLGYGLYQSVDQAILVSVLPDKEKAGKDLGILNASTTAGQAVGPIITGAVVTATAAYALVFPIAVGFIVLAAVGVIFIKNVR